MTCSCQWKMSTAMVGFNFLHLSMATRMHIIFSLFPQIKKIKDHDEQKLVSDKQICGKFV